MDESLRSHLIDPASLRSGDFDGFFAKRQQMLLDKIAGVMGKTLIAVPEEALEALDDDEEDEV